MMAIDVNQLIKIVEPHVIDGTVSAVIPCEEDARVHVEGFTTRHEVEVFLVTEMWFRFGDKTIVGLTTMIDFRDPDVSAVSDSKARKAKKGETIEDLVAFVMNEEALFLEREANEAKRKCWGSSVKPT